MVDEVLYDLGVDFDSSFRFVDGDIILSKYTDNIVQAIRNRLNTDLNEMALFYENYGSVLNSFFGWRGNDETITYIKAELETVLSDEDRLSGWSYDLEYTGNGVLRIDLTLTPMLGSEIEMSLELNENGVEVTE